MAAEEAEAERALRFLAGTIGVGSVFGSVGSVSAFFRRFDCVSAAASVGVFRFLAFFGFDFASASVSAGSVFKASPRVLRFFFGGGCASLTSSVAALSTSPSASFFGLFLFLASLSAPIFDVCDFDGFSRPSSFHLRWISFGLSFS